MIGDGEAVRLVTHPLQQVHAFGLAFEDDRVFVVRHPDLFESLRQTADGHIVHAAIGQSLRRGHDLRMAAVDDDQIRDVGEMMPVRVLLDDSRVPYAVRRRCRRRGCGCIGRSGTTFVVHAVAGVAGDVAVSEPSRQRLVKGAQIVERTLAVITANGESAVFGFLGDGVLEHDHRGDLERPAHGVRNVVAFYAQRCLSEPECLRDVVHGRGARAHVADAAHLAALQRLPGVLVRPVHQRLLLAAACHADGDHGATQPAQP